MESGLSAGEIRLKLVRWFWCSVFGQAYENSPNSQAAKDFAEVSKWIMEGIVPSDVASFSFEPASLYEVTPKQRALYSGVIALILSNHSRDFHSLSVLTRALMEENNVDDHHIFPDKHLQEAGVKESKRRDCVLNRTLIDRATNQILSRRAPGDYFAEMKAKLGAAQFNKLTGSHMLPEEADSTLLRNDYDGFLDWRCNEIGNAISEVTNN